MTDDKGKTPDTPEAPVVDGKLAEPTQPATDAAPQMFPLDYVQQLRQEAKNYRTKLKEQETTQAAQREAELAKNAEWEKLANERAAKLAELDPIKTAYEKMLENLKASNTKRIELVPEDRRSLIPEYDDDPSKLASWLDANSTLLSMKPQAPNINGAAGSGQRPGAKPLVLSDDEIAVAKKMGLTPEQYAESKQKITR